MTSVPPFVEQPESALSESWATLSANDGASEDGTCSEKTDTASLIGRSTADDVVSLEGQDDDESERDHTDVDLESDFSGPSPSNIPPYQAYDDTLAPRDDDSDMHDSFPSPSNSIVFNEPESWSDTETITFKRAIRRFDETKNPEVLNLLPFDVKDGGHLTVSVQQSMSRQTLNVDRPFRVLYIGDEIFRPQILDKIGDVLVTSSSDSFNSDSSTTFHVVPTSFGIDSTPNYAELLPIHVQLVLEECTAANARKQSDGPDKISLVLKGSNLCTSTWNGSGYDVQSKKYWAPPDIAIFMIGDHDTLAQRKTRRLAHSFMKRHGIPCMVVSQSPLWTRFDVVVPLDYNSLHICLESRDTASGESKILGRFPIDLHTFENIAPGQLNRNLASLVKSSTYRSSTLGQQSITSPSRLLRKCVRDLQLDIDRYIKVLSDMWPYDNGDKVVSMFKIAGIFVITACVGLLGHEAIKFLLLLLSQLLMKLFGTAGQTQGGTFVIEPNTVVSTFTSTMTETYSSVMTHTYTATVTASFPTTTADSSSGCDQKNIYSPDGYEISPCRPEVKNPGENEKYQVHAFGDSNIILIWPPTRILTSPNPPTTVYFLTRNGVYVHSTISHIVPGVFMVVLAQQDAYGTIRVTIETQPATMEKYVIDVDFSSPWLKLEAWKRAARSLSSQLRKELSTAQLGIFEAYNRVTSNGGSCPKSEEPVSNRATSNGDSCPRCEEPGSIQWVWKWAEGLRNQSIKVSDSFQFNAKERVTKSSQHLRRRMQSIHREAGQLKSLAWTAVNYRANFVRQSVQRDYGQIKDMYKTIRKCSSLAWAQRNAYKLTKSDSRARKSKNSARS
ncbi:hypothetical protein FQN57_007500 [Myotisia sp. PD_48]|nr:hypothetical protein FQN57_007500 [Myotisia sp. PD_48]